VFKFIWVIMDLIEKGSEEQFVTLLDAIQTNPNPWVSVYVNMVRISEEMLAKESLSQETMAKIEDASKNVAKTLYNSKLNKLDGKIFVFEDSDVLALFKKDNGEYKQELERIREDFTAGGLGFILSIDEMKDKLDSLVALSGEKKTNATNYRAKRYALQVTELIFSEASPAFIERDLVLNIQRKRSLRTQGCILLIEDDVVARGLVAVGLRDKYKILHAKDAESGIISYIDNAPDMVFLDIHLPDHNGFDVLERIKWVDPNAFVIMLSGDSVPKNVIATKVGGAAGFIRKPFSKEKIIYHAKLCPTLAYRE
jgi:CheY-like chemotaxis protein